VLWGITYRIVMEFLELFRDEIAVDCRGSMTVS